MIDALLQALALKHVDREGWRRIGVQPPESVAAHSWGVSFLVLCLAPAHLPLERCLAYATLHDLAEAHTGDITPADGVSAQDKHRLEEDAMVRICHSLPPRVSARMLERWRDYERQADPEARFVKQLDRLDMALQALIYSESQFETTAFVSSAERFITHPTLRPLIAQVRQRI